MENRTVLDATTEIVVAALSNKTVYPDKAYAQCVAEFIEIIHSKLMELEFDVSDSD